MKAATIDMMPRAARTEAERYAKCNNLTAQDRAIMKAYRSIAHGGKVISLDKTFRNGGAYSNGMPKLAICRADAERVEVQFYQQRIEFSVWHGHYDAKNRRIEVPNFTTIREGGSWAKPPYIPPYVRKSNMSQLWVLWEATWQSRPSGDPFLLERIDENLFRIVAAWDVTPVEAAAIR